MEEVSKCMRATRPLDEIQRLAACAATQPATTHEALLGAAS